MLASPRAARGGAVEEGVGVVLGVGVGVGVGLGVGVDGAHAAAVGACMSHSPRAAQMLR